MSSTVVDQVDGRGTTVQILLQALTMTLGLQMWRALFPMLVFVLRDRFGWNTVEVGALALVVFLTGTLAGPLRRWLGPGLMVALAAGGTGLFRLGLQVWNGEATVELGLALAGSVFFILSLPNLLGGDGRRSGGRFALGILLGLTLDLALHGFWRTYDLSWQAGAGALLVTALLVAIQVALLAHVLREGGKGGRAAPLPLSPAWLALGPYLFLALLVWQNLARLTVLTGWSQALAFTWMVTGQGVVLAGVIWLLRSARVSALALGGAGLALLVAGLLPWWPEGAGAAVSFLMGHAGGALALTGLLSRVGVTEGRRGEVRGVALAHGGAMFLFVVFAFLYYSGFDISLPFSNGLLPLLAAVLVLGAPRSPLTPLSDAQVTWRPALLAVALLVLPLYRLATAERPPAAEGRFPLRVMTYNLHNGFDTDGHLGMEALAAVIEAQEPDVVALQEVSRGWVTNGSVDTLAWLAQRLDMHAHYAPTADILWGMGILSRAPIIEGGSAMLPPEDLLLKRGYEWAVVDLGEDGRRPGSGSGIGHSGSPADIRVVQAQALVKAWKGTSPLVVAGDFNARPSDPEMGLIAAAGMEDVVTASGLTPGYTFSSAAPYKQIDYIWLSADLTATDVTIPFSTASDHFAVAATIRRAAGGEGAGVDYLNYLMGTGGTNVLRITD